jgi:hypothetical protein
MAAPCLLRRPGRTSQTFDLRFSWPSLISAVSAFSRMANASTCLAVNTEKSIAPIRRLTKNSSTNVSLSGVI